MKPKPLTIRYKAPTEKEIAAIFTKLVTDPTLDLQTVVAVYLMSRASEVLKFREEAAKHHLRYKRASSTFETAVHTVENGGYPEAIKIRAHEIRRNLERDSRKLGKRIVATRRPAGN